jgi:hypothetical protein
MLALATKPHAIDPTAIEPVKVMLKIASPRARTHAGIASWAETITVVAASVKAHPPSSSATPTTTRWSTRPLDQDHADQDGAADAHQRIVVEAGGDPGAGDRADHRAGPVDAEEQAVPVRRPLEGAAHHDR